MGSHLSVGIELHDDPGGLLLGDADELHDVGVVQLLHQHCGKRGIPTLEWGSRFRDSQSLCRGMEAEQEELSGISPRGWSSWFLGMDSLIQGFQRLPHSNNPFP